MKKKFSVYFSLLVLISSFCTSPIVTFSETNSNKINYGKLDINNQSKLDNYKQKKNGEIINSSSENNIDQKFKSSSELPNAENNNVEKKQARAPSKLGNVFNHFQLTDMNDLPLNKIIDKQETFKICGDFNFKNQLIKEGDTTSIQIPNYLKLKNDSDFEIKVNNKEIIAHAKIFTKENAVVITYTDYLEKNSVIDDIDATITFIVNINENKVKDSNEIPIKILIEDKTIHIGEIIYRVNKLDTTIESDLSSTKEINTTEKINKDQKTNEIKNSENASIRMTDKEIISLKLSGNPNNKSYEQYYMIPITLDGTIYENIKDGTVLNIYFDSPASYVGYEHASNKLTIKDSSGNEIIIGKINYSDTGHNSDADILGQAKLTITFNKNAEKLNGTKFTFNGYIRNRVGNKGKGTIYTVGAYLDINKTEKIGEFTFTDTTKKLTSTDSYLVKKTRGRANGQFVIIVNQAKHKLKSVYIGDSIYPFKDDYSFIRKKSDIITNLKQLKKITAYKGASVNDIGVIEKTGIRFTPKLYGQDKDLYKSFELGDIDETYVFVIDTEVTTPPVIDPKDGQAHFINYSKILYDSNKYLNSSDEWIILPSSTDGNAANIRLIKEVDKKQAKVGDSLTYTLTAENNSKVDWTGTISDELAKDYVSYLKGSTKVNGEKIDDDTIWKDQVLSTKQLVKAGDKTVITFEVTATKSAAGKTIINTATTDDPNVPSVPPVKTDIGDIRLTKKVDKKQAKEEPVSKLINKLPNTGSKTNSYLLIIGIIIIFILITVVCRKKIYNSNK